ncbi:sensor histidine kinase [Actinomadura scrupuli]|uniref:sensor histidine kinase n=1 Tax=Actinomadura scrupuli TaxID=559629 RepID=UPI003D9929DE
MRLRYDWSVRTRMTLLSSAVIGLLSLAFCGIVLMGLREHSMRDRADEVLLADLRVVRLIARNELPRVINDRSVSVVQVVNARGRIVAANEAALGKPRIAYFVPPAEGTRADRVSCSVPGFPHRCMIIVAVRISIARGEWIVYGADPVVPWYVNGSLLTTLVAGSVLLIIATAFGTYRAVRNALAPVEDVVGELTEITASDLGRRVPVSVHDDEMRGLAVTVNQTLDRLETAVERQRRFASDASHDLRSPITAMRLQVEEAQLHPDETDWTKTAEALAVSLDRLEAIVTDLLALARLESGTKCAREPIDLGELVGTELAVRTDRIPVTAGLQPGVMINGDRLQLIRLLTNLLDNAERHAVSAVTVRVRGDAGEAVLEVCDDGSGIPPDQWERVFERFTRLDTARSKDAGGTGLGLPIAREIAEQHGGTLTIEDSDQGARFVLRIPVHDSSQAQAR